MTNETPVLHCANHPDRETMLRCNRCDKPICFSCAVQTPVGYRCRECVRGQQAVYYSSAKPHDLPVGALTALLLGIVLGALAYAFLDRAGWFSILIAILAGSAAGGAVVAVVRRVLHKRRARGLKWAAAAAFLLGVLLGGLLLYAGLWLAAGLPATGVLTVLDALFTQVDVLVFAGFAAGTIYTQLF